MTHFRELPEGEWCGHKSESISFQMAIACSFNTLRTLFGEPRNPSHISYNSRYEWDVTDIDSGICCTIYEWISKGVLPKNYPNDWDIRKEPEYKWNIGAASMSDATKLFDWLRTRDYMVRHVKDWADPLAKATERRKQLMKNYTVVELRKKADDMGIIFPYDEPILINKEALARAIAEAEYHDSCR